MFRTLMLPYGNTEIEGVAYLLNALISHWKTYVLVKTLNYASSTDLHKTDHYRNTQACVPSVLGGSPDIWTHQQSGTVLKTSKPFTIIRRKLKNFPAKRGTRVCSRYFCFIFKVLNFSVSLVKPTRCTSVSKYFILEWHSTCFGRSFRPSSWIQDCTYSNRHISNRYCCLLVSKHRAVSVLQLYVQYCSNRHLSKTLAQFCAFSSVQLRSPFFWVTGLRR